MNIDSVNDWCSDNGTNHSCGDTSIVSFARRRSNKPDPLKPKLFKSLVLTVKGTTLLHYQGQLINAVKMK